MYHFNLHDGTSFFPDLEGTRLSGMAAVQAEARQIARDLLQDGFRDGRDRLGWWLDVMDDRGVVVATYQLAAVAKDPQ